MNDEQARQECRIAWIGADLSGCEGRYDYAEWAWLEATNRSAERVAELEHTIASQAMARSSLFNEMGEMRRRLKNYEPTSVYDGLSIEQWKARCERAEAALTNIGTALTDAMNSEEQGEATIATLTTRNAALTEALRGLKQGHYTCEDRWYSCPLSEDGCADDSQEMECNCGAEKRNTSIDALLTKEPQP